MTEEPIIPKSYDVLDITIENFPRFKTGANYSDVNKIKQFTAAGYTAKETAYTLGIVQTCVDSYIKGPRKKPGPKPKQVATNERNLDS
jgi:hypothetical protein